MFIKHILYMFIYFQTVHSYVRNITINSEYISENYIQEYSKNAVSKDIISMSNNYGHNYYCRDNNCISFKNDNPKMYIEFPDENGNIKKYILKTCPYEDIFLQNKECPKFRKNEIPEGLEYIYYTCNSDSECFFNKCINNYCVFNDKSPITHCDIIYKYFSIFHISYLHCGKTYGQLCNESNECSSESCCFGECSSAVKTPEDEQEFRKLVETICSILALISIFVLICIIHSIYSCYKNKYKKINH